MVDESSPGGGGSSNRAAVKFPSGYEHNTFGHEGVTMSEDSQQYCNRKRKASTTTTRVNPVSDHGIAAHGDALGVPSAEEVDELDHGDVTIGEDIYQRVSRNMKRLRTMLEDDSIFGSATAMARDTWKASPNYECDGAGHKRTKLSDDSQEGFRPSGLPKRGDKSKTNTFFSPKRDPQATTKPPESLICSDISTTSALYSPKCDLQLTTGNDSSTNKPIRKEVDGLVRNVLQERDLLRRICSLHLIGAVLPEDPSTVCLDTRCRSMHICKNWYWRTKGGKSIEALGCGIENVATHFDNATGQEVAHVLPNCGKTFKQGKLCVNTVERPCPFGHNHRDLRGAAHRGGMGRKKRVLGK